MEHEWNTVKYFLELGKDIELLPKSVIKHYHQGDFMMDGVAWEAFDLHRIILYIEQL